MISHVLDSQVHWSFFFNIYHVNPVFGLPTDSSSLVILRFFKSIRRECREPIDRVRLLERIVAMEDQISECPRFCVFDCLVDGGGNR